MTLAAAKSALLGTKVRTETRYASSPAGSGALACGFWGLSPIVAVTSKTIVVEFQSGRRQSIRLETGVGGRGHGVVTGLHPEDLVSVREVLALNLPGAP